MAAGLDDSVDYFMSQMDALNVQHCLPKEENAASKEPDRERNGPLAPPLTQGPIGGGERPFYIDTQKLDQPVPETAALQQRQLQGGGSKTSLTLREGQRPSATLEQSWNAQPA